MSSNGVKVNALSPILSTVNELLDSKKATILVAAELVIAFSEKFGAELPATHKFWGMVAIAVAWLFSQGLSDFGKDRTAA